MVPKLATNEPSCRAPLEDRTSRAQRSRVFEFRRGRFPERFLRQRAKQMSQKTSDERGDRQAAHGGRTFCAHLGLLKTETRFTVGKKAESGIQ